MVGYEVTQEGNIIHIGQTSVGVAEACNGLRMITAFLVISGLVVLLVRRAWWEKLVVFASSLPIALLCNTTRLAITAVIFTMISGFLFGAGLEFQTDLDRGIISEELRQKFEENDVLLSQDVTVLAEQPGSRWQIADKSKKYSVMKHECGLDINLSSEYWEKVFHDFGGYAMMPLAVAMLIGELWLLGRLTTPRVKKEAAIITRKNG